MKERESVFKVVLFHPFVCLTVIFLTHFLLDLDFLKAGIE